MNKRKIVIFSLIVISAITVGILYWYSELAAENRANEYIHSLKEAGCIVEEYPFSDSHVLGVVKMYSFGDFHSFAMLKEIGNIYCDRATNSLYFFHNIQDVKVEIILFNY